MKRKPNKRPQATSAPAFSPRPLPGPLPGTPAVPSFAAKAGTLTPNQFELRPSPGLASFLAENNVVIAFTTYHTGQLILLGTSPEGQLVYTVRTYEKLMGIVANQERMHIATNYMIWHLYNMVRPGEVIGGYGAVYVPRASNVTGALDVHDMVLEDDGRLLFVNTVFSCVCALSQTRSFKPVWVPPWISALLPEDRCHMNGLTTRDGKARYITAVSRTDTKEGWREVRVGSGVIYDIVENRPVAEGLTMPHSPRYHNGRLFFINSGSGYVCEADIETGRITDLCFCPGFARGLAIMGDHIVVGTSDQRVNRTFSDLSLEENLKRAKVQAGCGVHIINQRSGQIEHSLGLSGSIKEIYDVCVLPGVSRANAIGFMNEDIQRMVEIERPV